MIPNSFLCYLLELEIGPVSKTAARAGIGAVLARALNGSAFFDYRFASLCAALPSISGVCLIDRSRQP